MSDLQHDFSKNNFSKNDFSKYEDMLYLPHHTSANRPPMSRMDRAAQFSPFAALSGYGDAVEDAARLSEEQAAGEIERIAYDDLSV